MKKIRIILLIIVLQLFLVNTVLAEVEFSQELFLELAESINEVPHIQTPDYDRIELDNGMVVYLAEDKELPIVEVSGFIKGGISQESKELAGISSVMTRLMNTGTENYSELELARYKELNGLSFNLSSSYDRFNFSANSLSIDKDKLIGLMAEILRNPQFEADYYQRIIQEYYQVLLQQYYYDTSLVDIYFNTNLYGEHPYGYSNNLELIIAALQGITPEKLERFYQKTIHPANLVMAISGDFDITEMEKLIRKQFGGWNSSGTQLAEKVVVATENNYNQIILVNKPDATHARMKMGYNFYNNHFEHRVPFLMANRVFGSGDFSSRLMDNLRNQLGYVYGIYSAVNYYQLGGLYYITTDVAPDKAYETMEAIKEEMLVIKEGHQPISKEELFRNVNLYNALFPKSYKKQINILAELMYDIEVVGKGEDAINDFIQEYNSLSAEQVQAVFADYTYPERFLTVIVGRKEDILPAFQKQGLEVEVVEAF